VSGWTKRCGVEWPELIEQRGCYGKYVSGGSRTLRLRAEIESIYRRVATEPSGDFHFHRGPTYVAERLGYDAAAGIALLTSTASKPSAVTFSAWSRIKAINGETTTVIPGNSIAGTW
jgi:hypothetical protein